MGEGAHKITCQKIYISVIFVILIGKSLAFLGGNKF